MREALARAPNAMRNENRSEDQLRQDVEAIVRIGRSIRHGVRNATAAAVHSATASGKALSEVVRAGIQGAADGLAGSPDPSDPFCQAVEGVADGLVAAAQAVQWTVREAAASSRTYARQDLDAVADEFGALATLFVDGVVRGMRASGKHAECVAAQVREHAHTTLRRAWPAFAAAASTARREPLELGIAALESGARVANAAVGELHRELGAQLEKLGVALQRRRDEAI
jgi:hypothetical protein